MLLVTRCHGRRSRPRSLAGTESIGRFEPRRFLPAAPRNVAATTAQTPPSCPARVFLWVSTMDEPDDGGEAQFTGDVLGLASILRGYRYNVGSECDFHRGVLDVLRESRIDCESEYDLGPGFGRIDLYLPRLRIGIELKVKESPSQILRQLHRYARCPVITSLLLITSRPRLNPLPLSVHGKRLVVLSVWEVRHKSLRAAQPFRTIADVR